MLGMEKYLNARGEMILKALDQISTAHGAKPVEVALAWLITRDGVTAPIASATSVAQVESFANAASLKLAPDEVDALIKAGLFKHDLLHQHPLPDRFVRY